MDGNKNFTDQSNINFDFINKELKFNSTTKMFENKNLKKRRREEEIYGTFYGDITDYNKVNESKSNKNSNEDEDIFSNWDFGRKGKKNENVDDENESNNFSTKSTNYLYLNFVKGEKQFLVEKENKNSDPNEKNKFGITLTHRQEKLDSDEEVEKEFLKDYTADKIEKSKNNIKDEKKAEAKLKETFGKGFAMLKKSGYKLGSGLGKNEQGITVPIEIKKRKRNAGISNEKEGEEKSEKHILNNLTNISKLKEKHIEKGRTELDEFEKILENWEEIRNILMSSDIIDFEIDLKTQNYDVTQFIIQSRKKENFLYDKKSNLSQNNLFDKESFEDTEEIDKIKEELVKVMKKSKEKVSGQLSKIKSISDSTVNFDYEIEYLQEELKGIELIKVKKEKFLSELNHFINDIEQNVNSDSDNIESYIRFASHLIHLYTNNRLEYLKYSGMTSYCLELTERFLSSQFSFIDYLKKSKNILPLILEIKNLVYKTENEDNGDIMNDNDLKNIDAEFGSYTHIFPTSSTRDNDPDHIPRNEKIFGNFLNKIVIKNLISYIINEWNVKEYEVLHKVFDIYSAVIPNFMKDYIIDSVLIPRLLEEIIEKWELNIEFTHVDLDEINKPKVLNFVHLWIHPWLDLIKLEKLAPISKVIQDKIENKILSCDLGNSDLIDILQPWKKIWDEAYFQNLSNKYIIPKLNYFFSKMQINPKDQDLKQLKILFKWNQSGLLQMEKCLPILLKHFFPKWLQTLSDWLYKSPNSEKKFEEIQNWYLGWKSLFSGNYLKFKEIEQEFKNALVLITSS